MLSRIVISGAAVLALAVGVITSGDALAGKGGGGHNTATITFANPQFAAFAESWPAAGDSVSFAVTANVRDRDLYKLWVANKCSQDGVPVYAAYLPLHDGLTDPFTLDWPGGGAADCVAYVWLFPDTETPLSGGSMSYSVGP